MPSFTVNQFLSVSVLLMSTTLSASMPIRIQWEELFERQSSNCFPLTVDQAKQLPGWSKLEQYAKDNWGEGGWNIVTNPEDFRDRPANACIEVARVPLQWNQQPQCGKSTALIEGKSTGTSTKVAFDVEQGTEAKTSLTVTRSSSITTSVSFNVGFQLPSGLGGGVDTSFSTTISNEQSKTVENTSGKILKQHYEFENGDGKQCKMTVETSDCAGTANGRIPVVAKGFVWFNYEDKRAPKNDPGQGEHYKYSANIESVLNEGERTSWIEVQGPINTVTKSSYDTNCSGSAAKATPKKGDEKGEGGSGGKKPSGTTPPPKKGAPNAPEPRPKGQEPKKPAKPESKPAPGKTGPKQPAPKQPAPKQPLQGRPRPSKLT